MFTNPRRQRHLKKKIIIYVFILGILGASVFSLNTYFVSKKPLFVSPLGKIGIDKVYIEKLLKENNILFSQVSASSSSYLVNIQNNGQVRLSQNKNINQQIASLQRILIQLTIEGKSFKIIDFRFSEPIISY